ncbi:MAG: efflux RND transporter periplasmic adaptor subunit [Gemmatimonadaceae bacterium]|nr:efflux RND transporter periplasmic adaptor subunit [Acetobacteraceae bacterium]
MIRLVLLALLLAAPATAAPPMTSEPRPPSVTVLPAVRGSIAEVAVLTGTLVPREEVLVSPQIEGLALIEILAEEGDTVKAGQVLARLSRDVLEATVAQNAAQIARADAAIAQSRSSIIEAQANRNQVDLALARTRDLLQTGNASREVFEQRQAASLMAGAKFDLSGNALRAAEADRALAEAQRRESLVRLARTELRAPVDGIISRRIARLGAVVMGAGDALFRIIERGAVELEADVPETSLAKLRPGQGARIDTASGPRTGLVRLVSPEVSRTTRLGRVRVEVANDPADGPLVIGSFARAGIEVARRDGVLVPLSAVLFQPDGAVVQVVRDNVVETRRVQVGLRNGTQAEIMDGVADGEFVVSVSGTFIRGGDRVTPVTAKGS